MPSRFLIGWVNVIFVFLASACPAKAVANSRDSANQNPQPNVVLILIDDLGWKDLGCYGNLLIDTPNIDSLAKRGLRFTNFYASGAVCSPTRCAIQSGQNQARIGITAHIPGHWRPYAKVQTPKIRTALPLDTITIAETLKTAGYDTGYIGKWHLGWGREFQPDRQGYDYSAVISGPHLPGRYRVQNRQLPQPKTGQYRTDYEADLVEHFISKRESTPFFLMVSPFAVHIPLAGMDEKVSKYRKRFEEKSISLPHPVYAAMVEHCDDLVGRTVQSLRRKGCLDNTIIIVTSDNGGLYRRYDYRQEADDNVTSMAPLRNEKGSLYEGGIRVPCIMAGPGISPAVSFAPLISHDFYPTLASLAEAQLPESQIFDGVNFIDLLSNPQSDFERGALFWHYPHYHHDRPASCIRVKEWKLIEFLDGSGDVELYQLVKDIGETTNLAEKKPNIKQRMLRKLRQWRTSVAAAMPHPNPNYDPKRSDQWWSYRTGKPVPSDARKRFPATEAEDQARK